MSAGLRIVPFAEEHVERFCAILDAVAREERYLAMLQAPERTLADARAKGFTRIELTVRTDNEPAKRLYGKFGFAVEGLCRRHMRVRGEYYDSYLMALLYD